MTQFVIDTVSALGYPGVLVLMFLENVFPPVPSEMIMPFAGMVASRGVMTVWGVILAGTIGSILGSLPLYYLGARVGEERLKQWADRYGHWVALSREDLDRAHEWFERRGPVMVLVCRLIPGIRSWISVPAGAQRMHMAPFLFYTAIGAAVWTAALTYAGVLLGYNYPLVEKYISPVAAVVIVGLTLVWLVRVVRFHQRRAART